MDQRTEIDAFNPGRELDAKLTKGEPITLSDLRNIASQYGIALETDTSTQLLGFEVNPNGQITVYHPYVENPNSTLNSDQIYQLALQIQLAHITETISRKSSDSLLEEAKKQLVLSSDVMLGLAQKTQQSELSPHSDIWTQICQHKFDHQTVDDHWLPQIVNASIKLTAAHQNR